LTARVVAGGDPAELHEPTHAALNLIAAAVGGPVKLNLTALIRLGWDHRGDATPASNRRALPNK
jgi:hypothetical protein